MKFTLEIQGFADTINDREGLKNYLFERKFKTIKLKDLIKKTDDALSLDSVKLITDDFEKYTKKVYNNETFVKPRNNLGIAKSLTVSEMKELIYKNIEITSIELKNLAAARALGVKEYLINKKKVNVSRIFLIEPEHITPQQKPDIKNSRVDFVIKAR